MIKTAETHTFWGRTDIRELMCTLYGANKRVATGIKEVLLYVHLRAWTTCDFTTFCKRSSIV